MSWACLRRRSEFPLMGYQWPCPPEWLEVWRFVLLWRGFCSLQSCHWHPKHLCFPGPSVMHVNTSLHFAFWAGILLGLVACWKWPGYKQHPLPRWAFLSCQHVVWVYCADFFPLEGSCLPFHYHFSHWMWVSEFLTLVLNAIVEFIKLNARTVAHFDSVSVHQALRFDIYIHVYFLRNFWSRLCQVGLTWPWECRHQAGLETYAPARTWRHSTPPAWKEACFRLQAFHPVLSGLGVWRYLHCRSCVHNSMWDIFGPLWCALLRLGKLFECWYFMGNLLWGYVTKFVWLVDLYPKNGGYHGIAQWNLQFSYGKNFGSRL